MHALDLLFIIILSNKSFQSFAKSTFKGDKEYKESNVKIPLCVDGLINRHQTFSFMRKFKGFYEMSVCLAS